MERVSEVVSHDLRYRRFVPEGVTFALSDLLKKSRAGLDLKTSFHVSYEVNRNLCVISVSEFMNIALQNSVPWTHQNPTSFYYHTFAPRSPFQVLPSVGG